MRGEIKKNLLNASRLSFMRSYLAHHRDRRQVARCDCIHGVINGIAPADPHAPELCSPCPRQAATPLFTQAHGCGQTYVLLPVHSSAHTQQCPYITRGITAMCTCVCGASGCGLFVNHRPQQTVNLAFPWRLGRARGIPYLLAGDL